MAYHILFLSLPGRCSILRLHLAPPYTAALRFLERAGSSNGAENIKQRSIGGDLEVEIQEAVHENADATE